MIIHRLVGQDRTVEQDREQTTEELVRPIKDSGL